MIFMLKINILWWNKNNLQREYIVGKYAFCLITINKINNKNKYQINLPKLS